MKRLVASAALAIVLFVSPASGQVAAPAHYSTAKTQIGMLMSDAIAWEVIGRRFPMLVQSKAVASGMANRMTLRSLKRFKPAIFTETALAELDAEFAKIPGR